MKLILFTISFFLLSLASYAQGPGLSAGLDALTLNKGTINVEVLTQIIVAKQKELKQEALKRFMFKLFPETNYTTKYYIQNCLNTLLNEKNPQVIQKQIFEFTTNYALAIGVAKFYAKSPEKLAPLKDLYYKFKINSIQYREQLLSDYKNYSNKVDRLDQTLASLKLIDKEIDEVLWQIGSTATANSVNEGNVQHYKKLKELEAQRKDTVSKISRIKIRNGVVEKSTETTKKTDIPFDIIVDVVASALSDIDALKKLGFFKTPIDYRNDHFYISLGEVGSRATSIDFQKGLIALRNDVKNQITPYITNYDIIKEFCISKKNDESVSIKDDLITKYAGIIRDIIGMDTFVKKVTETTNLFPDGLVKQYDGFITQISNLQRYQNITIEYLTTLNSLKTYQTSYETGKAQAAAVTARFDDLKNKLPDSLKTIGLDKIDLKKLDTTAAFFKDLSSLQNDFIKQTDSYTNALTSFDAKITVLNTLVEQLTDGIMKNVPKKVTHTITDSLKLSDFKETAEKFKGSLQTQITNFTTDIVKTGDFYNLYLQQMIAKLGNIKDIKVKTLPNAINKADFENYSKLLSAAYVQLNKVSANGKIALKDVMYIDEEVIPELIKASLNFEEKDQASLTTAIKDFRLLSQLLRIKAVSDIVNLSQYESSLVDLFSFIKDLDNLDRAETYQAMLNLLQDANTFVEDNLEDGKFKNTYILFSNAIKKYTLINTEEQYIQVDVVSFLTDLQQYFDRNNSSALGIYFTLGLNQNTLFKSQLLPGATGTDYTRYLGFASEKIGLKVRFANFTKLRGYENAIKTDVTLNKRAPFVNEIYGIAYGSGLLYSIANTSTTNNFNYPHIGIGTGVRFYNSLDVNLVVGFPFVKDSPIVKYAFWGIGLDIPLGEYLEKLGGKKQ